MPRKRRRAILIGLGVGAVGVVLSLIPFILNLEENAELDWLFSNRGAVAAPSDVVVIGIDKQTAVALGVSDELDEWPRSVHADLVGRLATAGASAIVFDINFVEARSSKDDQAFADAIQRAGNVVMLEYIEVGSQSPEEPADGAPRVLIERRFPPISLLRDQAIGTAPFPLPVVPVKVSRFWSFSPTTDNSPTLPIVAFQTYALPYYTEFLTLLGDVRPEAVSGLPKDTRELFGNNSLPGVILEIRKLFRTDPQIALDMRDSLDRQDIAANDQEARSVLLALIAMYQGVGSPYLNFYGPPRAITTVPYQDALQIPPDEFSALCVKGKVVFVGYSARTLMRQQDAYYSVFSQDSGLNLSGTEIAATAFANLLEMDSIKPLARPARLAFVFLWGIILAIALCFLSTTLGIGLAAVGGISYFAFASHQFASATEWWPIIIPIVIQLPIALYGANRLQLTEEKTEKEQILDSAVARLNRDLVDRLTLNVAGLKPDTESTGTCLVTDIQGFTNRVAKKERDGRLSEMSDRMHEYWTILVRAVAERGGFVRDFIGDSMVAVWLSSEQRSEACKAALAIRAEVERFNRLNSHSELPTRIGLYFGRLRIGSIGTAGLGTELLGEPANIASRIEGASKYLETEVLVSGPTLEGLEDDFVTRSLGAFLVKGKDEPVQLHELMDVGSQTTDHTDHTSLESFAEALAEFQKENWEQAAEMFKTLCEQFADDGPAGFYLKISKRYAKNGPDKNWNGVALRLPLDPSA